MSELKFSLHPAGGLHASMPMDSPDVRRGDIQRRVLLALDGQKLTPELQIVALKCCVHWTRRLDILLVNPPKAPTFLLGGLLLRLEHSGVDYRLESCEGEYSNAVLRYLQRFSGIGLVIANALPALDDHVSGLRLDPSRFGQRFIDLAEPERLRRLGENA